MEDYDDQLAYHSDNEEASYSDQVDSDIEAELYSLVHHAAQDNSVSLPDRSDSIDIEPVSLQKESSSTETRLVPADKNSELSLDNSVKLKKTVNSSKKQNNSIKKKNQNNSTPITTNNTSFFSSDTTPRNSLYYSFETPNIIQKSQGNRGQIENSKRDKIPSPSKRKSDVISEILGNIQLKKNKSPKKPESIVSKQKKKNSNNSSKISKTESFVEIIDDSSDSDSDSSIVFLEPDHSNLQTNITKETVVLSSDSEGSDSSMERNFSQACKRKQMEVSESNINTNNKDLWHINSADLFRTKRQSGRYHENAVLTCSKCHLKGHSAKFCSVPKAMKCFFCGDYHSGMNCRNKICTKCFQIGHDRRHCYNHYIDTCELCRMRGHSERNCPDIWRRYHLTTAKGNIIKGKPNPHSPLFCYNCGTKGHYGADCMENRIDRWSFPTWTSVISYRNPVRVFQNESKRIFQNEERIFQGRNIFPRTPIIHRKKGKEISPKDTPTKSRKKKKKKSPKTPPSMNGPSTSRTNNIVQNEVYFPRTPKMNSRMGPDFLSKKRKKLGKGEDQLARERELHRMQLHQRLGLPFPSTV